MPQFIPQKLNSNGYLIAYLDAAGKKPFEIAKILDVHVMTVRNTQQNADYKVEMLAVREDIKREIIERTLGRAELLEEAFNEEAYASFLRMVQLRDEGGKEDGIKFKAAEGILNRATEAPRVLKGQDSEEGKKIVINIPMQTQENMNRALESVGRGDVVKLLEGRDGVFQAEGEGDVGMVTPEEFGEVG